MEKINTATATATATKAAKIEDLKSSIKSLHNQADSIVWYTGNFGIGRHSADCLREQADKLQEELDALLDS